MKVGGWLLCLLAISCNTIVDEEDSKVMEYVKVGDHVPLFTVQTVDSDGVLGTFSTEWLTGETVIVLFHTTCSDCQRELPRLNDYYLQHRSDEGFQMVAISRAERAESVAAFWKEQGLSIPYSAQTDRSIYELFASSIIPRVYFCSSVGLVTRIYIEKLPNLDV